MSVLYPDRIEPMIWRCLFLWKEENLRTRRKTVDARREPTNKLNHMWSDFLY